MAPKSIPLVVLIMQIIISISFSYVVYCGLVFISLSQPYMFHQFGKDWATKAPLRLCKRVHGFAEEIDQEVVVLSQVLKHFLLNTPLM